MKEYEYIVLGAGPSGLTIAHALLAKGVCKEEILVIEKEAECGGLCRSAEVDGAPLDTGGGHFLDVKHQRVTNFLFQFMPEEEWELFDRVSKIKIHDQLVDHPLEANLWQLPTHLQVEYLESIAQAGCNSGENMPEAFPDWIRWKLGNKIAEEYMIPYNKKIWSRPLNELGTYWLYKLPNVSFSDTLLSCLEQQTQGTLPAHGKFYYPKQHGYGEVWRRMGVALSESLTLNTKIASIDLSNRVINGQWFATKNIITTVPWSFWNGVSELPPDIADSIAKLKHSSIDVTYEPETLESDAHWTYEPDEDLPHHRLLLRSNFAHNARGYWTETNSARTVQPENVDKTVFHNEHAYPLNTLDKPALVERIREWAENLGIIPLGRWGKWEHMNSDIAVLEALQLSDQLTGEERH